MFFSLSVLNLEDHLGLVISPQSPLSAGYITLRACRRSLPLRFSTVTPGGIVGFLIVSYRGGGSEKYYLRYLLIGLAPEGKIGVWLEKPDKPNIRLTDKQILIETVSGEKMEMCKRMASPRVMIFIVGYL